MKYESDILIIGSGIAGMSAACYAAEKGCTVNLVTKGDAVKDSNTFYAQGGIIFKAKNDPVRNLVGDIIKAGAKLSDPGTVKLLAREGPYYIQDLLINKAEIKFTKDTAGELDLTEEAAHSARRIIHCEDATGMAISSGLYKLMKKYKNIRIFNNHLVLDLILKHKHTSSILSVYNKPETLGGYILDLRSKIIRTFIAKATILATGGAGQIFNYTTNPLIATGDGFAIAERAGADIINMEYTQFHPTALYPSKPNMFLISEVVRGEGAQLKTIDNIDFMKKYNAKGSLAPRDIVARAIHEEMLEKQHPYVLLDISSYIGTNLIKKKFPTIYKTCLEHNIDITKQPVPVVPAFHYICGGIKVDIWGKTNIKRLFAIGEVSCTGVHGANRLASTSLLEGLVWGGRAVKYFIKNKQSFILNKSVDVNKFLFPIDVKKIEPVDPAFVKQDWDNLKNIMWNYVGLIRSSNHLKKALHDLTNLYDIIMDSYQLNLLEKNVIELKNGVETAMIITRHALQNKRSKGTHFRPN